VVELPEINSPFNSPEVCFRMYFFDLGCDKKTRKPLILRAFSDF